MTMLGRFELDEVYCGNSIELMHGIPDNSVDLIFTDPPYGHNNNNGDLISKWESALGRGENSVPRPIANDGAEANDLYRAMLTETKRVLVPGGCCCCCGGGGGPDPQFARWSLWMDEVLEFKQMIVWDKGKIGMGWHYRRSYETILVGQKKGAACKWYDTTQKIENIIRPGDYGISKIIPSADQHPTEKPIQLAMLFIRLHSCPGEIVFDPFCGHGSTLVAAKELGRHYIGFDVEQRFVDMARRRIAGARVPLTGLKIG